MKKLSTIALTISILLLITFSISAAQSAPGARIVEKVMTFGPQRGIFPQATVAIGGFVFFHDFFNDMMHRDPVTGEYLPPTAWEQQHPDAARNWFFSFENYSQSPEYNTNDNYTNTGRRQQQPRYSLSSEHPGMSVQDFMKLPGVQKNPDLQ